MRETVCCQFPVLSKKINSKNFPILFHKRQSSKMHSPFFAVKCEWSFAFLDIFNLQNFFYKGALDLYFIIECGSNKIVVITVGDHNKKFTLEIAIYKEDTPKKRKKFQRGKIFLLWAPSLLFICLGLPKVHLPTASPFNSNAYAPWAVRS